MVWTIHWYQPWLFSHWIFLRMLLIPHYCLIKSKGLKLQQCVLLDVAFLNSLLIQVLDELLPLHPVDERAGVAAVAEERPARQVQSTSCKKKMRRRDDVELWLFLTACYGHGSVCISLIMNIVLHRMSSSPQICAICRAKVSGEEIRPWIFYMFIHGGNREKKKKEEEEREKKAPYAEWSQLLFIILPANTNSDPTCAAEHPKKRPAGHIDVI